VFCTAGLGVLVLVAGVLAYRTRAARRGVGVFWDLACFWPRDTHPLAPPCYNERIMPQVSVRVAWYLGTDERAGAADPVPLVGDATVAGDRSGSASGQGPGSAPGREPESAPDPAAPTGRDATVQAGSRSAGVPDSSSRGRVVLAGHSQGSVIALAAALIQPAAARRRLSLITVGCVLDRLYSRFFPRYFGPDVYRLAAEMLSTGGAPGPAEPTTRVGGGAIAGAWPRSRWTNIWRHSDYLGGSVPYPPPGSPAVTAGDGGIDRGTEPRPDNVESTDPVFAPPPGDTVDPAARRHSDFWTDPAFLPAVHRLLRGADPDRRSDPVIPSGAR
jgi:hypothetical protein